MTGAAQWAGAVGEVWADEWCRTDRAFASLTRSLHDTIAAIAPDTGRALDVGCGAGETSLWLAASRPVLEVTGADLSAALIEVAHSRTTGAPNLSFRPEDATVVAADLAPVDLFVSRHGVMFFDDPVAAFTAFHTAATPGARLIFSCFGDRHRNHFAADIAEALKLPPPRPGGPGPFAFADPAHVRAILAAAGWRDVAAAPVEFAFTVGEGPHAAEEAVHFLSRVGPAAEALRAQDMDRELIRDRLRAVVAARAATVQSLFPPLPGSGRRPPERTLCPCANPA